MVLGTDLGLSMWHHGRWKGSRHSPLKSFVKK